MISVSFSICSFIYIIIFAIVYFSKTRINLMENKVYTYLLITTLIGLSIDIIGYFLFQYGSINSLKNIFVAKIYLVYYFTWIYLLTIYIYIVSTKTIKKIDYNKLFKTLTIVYLIIASIISMLKIYIKNTEKSLYTYGPSVNLVYLLSGICIIIMLVILLLRIKNIKKKEYIPLFVFIIFGSIVMIIQHQYPDLLLLITCQSIVTALMYFTIENPDVQMVEELNKNRKLTEQNFEEKTNFLFKISQDLKKPLLDISNISNEIIEHSNDEIKEQAKIINNNSKQLYTYVNNALDVSNMDIKNLKIINNTYNTENFFEEIKLRTKTEIKKQNKNIEFRYEKSSTIPKLLKGDNTKLKQIILSIIFDSIKHTNKGFVELNINSIIKYGICRLIIEISDSGNGMELDKINDILSSTGELSQEEMKRINTLDISLPLSHKIIKTINGNLIIKSEINEGTNFIIIIDQKIEYEKKTETEKKLEEYTEKILTNKNILIVTADKEILNKISKSLEEKHITLTQLLYSKDCVNELKQKKYETIIIDDELKGDSGIDVLKELQKNKITIPKIIMLDKSKEFIAEHYIEDGFNDYIIKEDIDEQIKKITKYL